MKSFKESFGPGGHLINRLGIEDITNDKFYEGWFSEEIVKAYLVTHYVGEDDREAQFYVTVDTDGEYQMYDMEGDEASEYFALPYIRAVKHWEFKNSISKDTYDTFGDLMESRETSKLVHVVRDATKQELSTLTDRLSFNSKYLIKPFDKGWLVEVQGIKYFIVPNYAAHMQQYLSDSGYIIFSKHKRFINHTTDRVPSNTVINSYVDKAVKRWELSKELKPDTFDTFSDIFESKLSSTSESDLSPEDKKYLKRWRTRDDIDQDTIERCYEQKRPVCIGKKTSGKKSETRFHGPVYINFIAWNYDQRVCVAPDPSIQYGDEVSLVHMYNVYPVEYLYRQELTKDALDTFKDMI